jgi:hypothetical protein
VPVPQNLNIVHLQDCRRHKNLNIGHPHWVAFLFPQLFLFPPIRAQYRPMGPKEKKREQRRNP